MTDLLEATSQPLTENVGGTDRTFSPLSIYDRAALLAADRANRKRQLIENLKAAELPKEDAFATLQDFDKDRTTEGDWVDLVNSIDGRVSIIRASLEKTYPGEGESVARQIVWDASKLLGVVCHVSGLEVAKSAPKESTSTFGDGGESPNPQTPPTFQPETPAKTEAA